MTDIMSRYDKIHNIRRDLVDALKKEFPDYGLRYVKEFPGLW